MAIAQLVDRITNAVEKNKTTTGIILDLSKAFNTIGHKLEHYGFRGIVLEWFKNHLTDWIQYVAVNDSTSKTSSIICGAPQGSILGSLLFILYVNDIIQTSNILDFIMFILFADDTTILYSHKDINNKRKLITGLRQTNYQWLLAKQI